MALALGTLVLAVNILGSEGEPTTTNADGRPRGELSFGAGPVVGLGYRTGIIVNARGGGPINEYFGLEASLASLVSPAAVGLFQGNLVANLTEATWREGKLMPFLTAGVGIGFPYPFFAINYGGGGKYYFNKRAGLRVDIRDNMVVAFNERGIRHTLEVSAGLTFRF